MSKTTTKEKVLEALKENGQRVVPELARILGIPPSTIKHNLLVLMAEGKVKKIKKSTRVVLYEVTAFGLNDEG